MDQICLKVREEDFSRIDIGDPVIIVDESAGIGAKKLEQLVGGEDEFNLIQYYGKYLQH
jgi:hypothetical protein